jgi:hypothetical protein
MMEAIRVNILRTTTSDEAKRCTVCRKVIRAGSRLGAWAHVQAEREQVMMPVCRPCCQIRPDDRALADAVAEALLRLRH